MFRIIPRRSRTLTNAALFFASIVFSFGALEAALLVVAGFGANTAAGSLYRYDDTYVSDKPMAVFDQISGYRRTPAPTRFLRIVHDQVVYDHTFTPNNAGYISARDYTRHKAPACCASWCWAIPSPPPNSTTSLAGPGASRAAGQNAI